MSLNLEAGLREGVQALGLSLSDEQIQRLLDYVKPDFVHVLAGGRIVRTGGPELALELEEDGYKEIAA